MKRACHRALLELARQVELLKLLDHLLSILKLDVLIELSCDLPKPFTDGGHLRLDGLFVADGVWLDNTGGFPSKLDCLDVVVIAPVELLQEGEACRTVEIVMLDFNFAGTLGLDLFLSQVVLV